MHFFGAAILYHLCLALEVITTVLDNIVGIGFISTPRNLVRTFFLVLLLGSRCTSHLHSLEM